MIFQQRETSQTSKKEALAGVFKCLYMCVYFRFTCNNLHAVSERNKFTVKLINTLSQTYSDVTELTGERE